MRGSSWMHESAARIAQITGYRYIRGESSKSNAACRPLAIVKDTMLPTRPCCWRQASSCCGWEASHHVLDLVYSSDRLLKYLQHDK